LPNLDVLLRQRRPRFRPLDL